MCLVFFFFPLWEVEDDFNAMESQPLHLAEVMGPSTSLHWPQSVSRSEGAHKVLCYLLCAQINNALVVGQWWEGTTEGHMFH